MTLKLVVYVISEDFDKAFYDIKPQFGIQQHRMFINSDSKIDTKTDIRSNRNRNSNKKRNGK